MAMSVENLLLLVQALQRPIVPPAVIPPPIEPRLSPFRKWKVLEEKVQVNFLDDKFEFVLNIDEAEQEMQKADIRLSDHLLSWMIELLPTLLSRPFMYARSLRNRDQANSLLRGRINSESTHKLAREIEEAVELDDEHVKIGRTDIQSMVRAEVGKQKRQERIEKKRKNSSGEVGASSPSTEKNGAASGGKKPKNQFNDASASTVGEAVPHKNAYKKKKKKKTKTPNSNNHKHDFRRGGKKNHQQNRPKGKGKGRDHDHQNQGG